MTLMVVGLLLQQEVLCRLLSNRYRNRLNLTSNIALQEPSVGINNSSQITVEVVAVSREEAIAAELREAGSSKIRVKAVPIITRLLNARTLRWEPANMATNAISLTVIKISENLTRLALLLPTTCRCLNLPQHQA